MDTSQWLEYILTIRPGYIYDIEGILKDLKNIYENFEYVKERSKSQTVRSEYIIGVTPQNFKLLREKIYHIYNSGAISPIIVLALIRKHLDNVIIAQIGLDKKDVNIFLNTDSMSIDIKNELEEISIFMAR